MKQVVVIRKDLGLSLGKYIAQAIHASQRQDCEYDYDGRVVCIVKYVKSGAKLLNIYNKCLEKGVVVGLQRDAGKTEVEAGTYTCLCMSSEDEGVVDDITKGLQLVNLDINW